jgi:hypothetical protein
VSFVVNVRRRARDGWAGLLAAPTSVILRRRAGLAALVSAVILPIIVIAAFSNARQSAPFPGDFTFFGPGGADILTGQWSKVFIAAAVQSGPFEMMPYGIPQLLGFTDSSFVAWVLFYTAFIYVIAFAFTLTVFIAFRPTTTRWYFYLGLIAAGVACAANFLPFAIFIGHPSDVVIPMFWVAAACFARDRCFVMSGVLIGLSAGWEVWGVLGAPVIFIAARPGLVRAAVAGIVSLAVVYGPFIATGAFEMFRFQWDVSTLSLPHLLFPGLSYFPWTLRLLQAVVALAAGCAMAFAARGTGYGMWLVPLAILSARLLLDPELYGYYWLAPAVIALGMAVSLVQSRTWIFATLAVLLVVWFAIPILLAVPGAIAFAVVTLAVGVLIGSRRRFGVSRSG